MRSWLNRVGLIACLCALAGCASLFGPRTVEVSQAQLQGRIDREFPLNYRLLEFFDVNVSAPRLSLRPEANRIATAFQVSVSGQLFRQPHRGTLALDYGVRFELTDNTLRLTQVHVDHFEIDDASIGTAWQLDRIGAQLAEHLLNDRVVYTLRPEDVEAVEGRGYRPSEIRVTRSGLAMTLLPLPAR